ncbi:MAG: 7TM-DISM domain-containing protein [Methylococcales bacterium]
MAKLLLLLWLLSQMSYATPPLFLTDKQQSYPLKFDILEDKTGDLTIADVIKEEFSAGFTSIKNPFVNYGITRSVYWIKFQISNEERDIDKW